MIDFRNAALALLRNCALGAGTLGEGGIVTGLGKHQILLEKRVFVQHLYLD